MAKAKRRSSKKSPASQIIFSTTGLLIAGLLIIFAGWLIDDNLGMLLVGFGSALLFISAVLYWLVVKSD